MVGPGESGPGAICAGAIPCGPIRPYIGPLMGPLICANVWVGVRPTPSHATAMAQRQNRPNPHPDIPAFLGFNRGNFKPNHPLHTLRVPAKRCLWAFLREEHGDLQKPCRNKILKPVLTLICQAAFSQFRLSPSSCVWVVAVLHRTDHPWPAGEERGETEPHRVGYAVSTPKDRGSFDYG